MPRVGSKSGACAPVIAAAPIDSGSRVSALGYTIIVASVVLMSTGCAAFPGGGAQSSSTATPSSPTATRSRAAQGSTPETLGFADGAQLAPLAMVG